MEQQRKRTKIVCTMGPASDSELTLRNLILGGMDIARLNFSHGEQVEQLARINRIKKVRRELDAPTAIMLDLRGPRIRTGRLAGGTPIKLRAGKRIRLTEGDVEGTDRVIHQSFHGLAEHVEPGTSILIDDGLIELAVDETDGSDIICTVQNTGMLGELKSMNFPDAGIKLPALTERDREDVRFGVEQGVDYVALSCVRNAGDVLETRAFLDSCGGSEIGVIAKIERADAVDDIEAIVDASDGILVARGDLGVEMDTELVPHIQKRIVGLCNATHTPVIVSGQMLESMVREPRATRAEVADVANAVYDGADALVLSTETAIGKYPVPSVRMMVRIVSQSERYLEPPRHDEVVYETDIERVSPTVGKAAVATAAAINAACIVTPTTSGRTARLISNLRPKAPIYAVAPNERVMRRMQLYWGVTPMAGGLVGASMRETIDNAQRIVADRGLAHAGDLAVFTAGDPHTGPVIPGGGDAQHVGTSVMYVVQIKDDAAVEEDADD